MPFIRERYSLSRYKKADHEAEGRNVSWDDDGI